MIDIHCHIICGVDDGPSKIKESIGMVLEAEKLGIKTIIATPHFHESLYTSERVVENFSDLVSRTNDCGVDLLLGYEVFITPNLPDMVKGKKDLLLSNSKCLLFELPFDIIPEYSSATIVKLHLENIIPIIAHPERNRYFVNNFNSFVGIIENGCLVQVDAASIIGVYGKDVKNFSKQLILHKVVDFVASDAHCVQDYTEWYLPAYRQVVRWAGEEYADRLFCRNAKMLMGDSKI